MGKAIFAGASAAFFTAYIAFAEALGILAESNISAISAPDDLQNRGGFNGFVDSLISVTQYGFDMISRFFQLLTFQVPGQEEAAIVTLFIFIPLSFINGWNIVTAIRGS